MNKNPVVRFEMPYKDAERVATFYKRVFGWSLHDTGPEMRNYIVAHTTDTDQNNMVTTPGRGQSG